MAGAVNVTTDTSVLSRFDQRLLKAERVLALCSGLAVFGLMVLAVVSVQEHTLLSPRKLIINETIFRSKQCLLDEIFITRSLIA